MKGGCKRREKQRKPKNKPNVYEDEFCKIVEGGKDSTSRVIVGRKREREGGRGEGLKEKHLPQWEGERLQERNFEMKSGAGLRRGSLQKGGGTRGNGNLPLAA